jgi:hypothetical protein
VSTASLAREVRRLRERRPSQDGIPSGPVALARVAGIEDLDSWQERVLRSDSARILLNVTRQGGKSSVAGLLATYKALSTPGSLSLILAPSERQAKETFAKAAHFYVWAGQTVPADSDRKLGMELSNGSRIEALPGTEKTVRGFSGVDLLILDEAARVDDGLYYAIRPMLAVSGGRLVMMSTPYGKRGVFYEEWTGNGEWERYEVPATECPRIPAPFLEEERRSMPEWWFAQEYLCEFRETEDQLFTTEMIERVRADDLEEWEFDGSEDLWQSA